MSDHSEPRRSLNDYFCADGCPVEFTLDVIGGKWKTVILYHLLRDKVLRFGELKKRLHGITQRMLTKQLRELEDNQIVTRKAFATVPPKVEYRLAPRGITLRPVVEAMSDWAEQNGREMLARQEAMHSRGTVLNSKT